jgi:hypothetical protein
MKLYFIILFYCVVLVATAYVGVTLLGRGKYLIRQHNNVTTQPLISQTGRERLMNAIYTLHDCVSELQGKFPAIAPYGTQT